MAKKQYLHSHFQAKRLIQIYWAVELTLLFVFIQRLYLGAFYYALLTFLVAFILIGVHLLAQKKKVIPAATFLLFVVTF